MKAFVRTRYGPPESLELSEVDAPEAPQDGVLVRVRALSVNAADWHGIRGEPLVARPMLGGLRRPQRSIVGSDVAGIVEAVGASVEGLALGDEVFGCSAHAFGEMAAGQAFVRKPAGLTFEQAAAVPVAGLTALQAVRDHGRVRSGQRVLVTGAGGGVGTYAVQIACAFGATVTALTSTDKVDLVRSIGAGSVIDYRTQAIDAAGPFDVILDVGASYSISRLRRLLAPDGILVLVGGSKGRIAGPITRVLAGAIRARLLRQRIVFFIAQVRVADLAELAELIGSGKVAPVIDRTFPFARTREALSYLESGQARGKVVVTLSE